MLLGLGDPDEINADRIASLTRDVRDKIAGLKEERAALALPSATAEQLEQWVRVLLDVLDDDGSSANLTLVIPDALAAKLKPSRVKK